MAKKKNYIWALVDSTTKKVAYSPQNSGLLVFGSREDARQVKRSLGNVVQIWRMPESVFDLMLNPCE